jgi:hypothetical protein
MTERKLNNEQLRKIVFAEMNAASYRVQVFAELLAEIDGRQAPQSEAVVDELKETKTAPKKESPKKETKKAVKEEVVEEDDSVHGGGPANDHQSDDDDMFGDEAEEDAGPTLDDVRKVVKDFATKHGKEKALKLLGKFKVTSIPDIKKQDYAKVIELAKKHL